ncbi:hypothetical protein VTI74DRAFT_2515 [Chaetomium olivicolor]
MFTKALVALATASLVGQTLAGPHQHGYRHAHQKKALVTEMVTITEWVTVTVGETETRTSAKTFYTNHRKSKTLSSSSSSTIPAAAPPSSSSVVVVPTTIVTQVTSTTPVAEQNTPPAPSPSSSEAVASQPSSEAAHTQAPAPPPPSSTAQPTAQATQPAANPGTSPATQNIDTSNTNNNAGGGSTGATGKRGLAYNNPELLKRFLNTNTKVTWTYNWGQYDDSGVNLEFCPMLWGLKLDFPDVWPKNAQKAIDSGSRCLFSFNEPDHPAQANMSPQLAATKHIELMNPFQGKASIGAPAITNSGEPGQGIQWLQQFFDACGGRCAVDFVNIHIYGVDTNTFLAHVRKVGELFKKPVWITEFAFGGSDSEINAQLETVIDQIETNSTYSFVERYSYFMVQDGIMVKGNSLSTYGNTFAYGA